MQPLPSDCLIDEQSVLVACGVPAFAFVWTCKADFVTLLHTVTKIERLTHPHSLAVAGTAGDRKSASIFGLRICLSIVEKKFLPAEVNTQIPHTPAISSYDRTRAAKS